MRARYPDSDGIVVRDGIGIRYERYGDGSPAILLLPTSHTVESERRRADRVDSPSGWATRNRHFWRQDGGYREWIEFFFGQRLPEPHSTKQYEDAVGWALDTDAEAMIAEREGRAAPAGSEAEELCRRIQCPVRVLHGSDDRCQPVARGRRVAELTGGDLVVLDGAGHLPHARDPVKVTRLITGFVDWLAGASMHKATWARGASRPRRAAKRPFIYFPLGHHFEQNFHVRHRLDRYGAGQCMDYATTDPDLIAAHITDLAGQPVSYRDVETGGAARAAQLIAELI